MLSISLLLPLENYNQLCEPDVVITVSAKNLIDDEPQWEKCIVILMPGARHWPHKQDEVKTIWNSLPFPHTTQQLWYGLVTTRSLFPFTLPATWLNGLFDHHVTCLCPSPSAQFTSLLHSYRSAIIFTSVNIKGKWSIRLTTGPHLIGTLSGTPIPLITKHTGGSSQLMLHQPLPKSQYGSMLPFILVALRWTFQVNVCKTFPKDTHIT